MEYCNVSILHIHSLDRLSGIKALVEFDVKFDHSISSEGHNESPHLIEVVERFKECTSYYLKRVFADQMYRIRKNRSYCRKHGIGVSGSELGRPSLIKKVDKQQEYQNNIDRMGVECAFSLSKRCYGMSCITTKLEETQCIICICVESFHDSVANTLCLFASVSIPE